MKERYQMFTTLIAKCARAIKRLKSIEVEEFGLKGLHASCLYYVYINEKPLTAKELCELCDEDKANISRAVDMLESDGFIVRNSKTQKKYNCPITLTDDGVNIAKRVAGKIDTIVTTASQGITEECRMLFYASLILIAKNLESIYEKHFKEGD